MGFPRFFIESADMSDIEKGSVVVKQTGSMACDAGVAFELDRPKKTVSLKMATARDRPFVSLNALGLFVTKVLPDHRVIAFNTDHPKSLTDWTIFVDVGEQRFEAQIVKQGDVNGGAVIVELYPAAGPVNGD